MAQPIEQIVDGAFILRGFVITQAASLLDEIEKVAAEAPFRHFETKRGFKMSAAMTNCGEFGWVSDRKGYRYQHDDPSTGRPWPKMPDSFRQIAASASTVTNFGHFEPDACLINRYEPGSGMGLHQDRDERDLSAPIVSVSLGVPAIFLFGTNNRKDTPTAWLLEHGDVLVWGGTARLNFHGIKPLKLGYHPLTGQIRFNLTLRKASCWPGSSLD